MQLFQIYTILIWFYLRAPFAVKAAKILAILPVFSKSHFNFNEAIMKSLHAAGHQVTVVHRFSAGNEIENYTEIYASTEDQPTHVNVLSISDMKLWLNNWSLYDTLLKNGEKICNKVLNLKEIERILHSDEPLFDLMFVDMAAFLHECYFPLAQKMGIPIIGTVSTQSWKQAEWTLGNPYPPATVPYEIGSYRSDRMSFVQRVTNTYDCVFDYLYGHLRIAARLDKVYRQHFPNLAPWTNVKPSLIFVNGHHVLLPRPLLPNIVYIGGIHLAPANTLPQDLQKFIDEAEHGVIVFSVGSVIRNDIKSRSLLLPFIEAFSQIPQRVIWKSDEKLENLSHNILQLEWLPQRDILLQKKVLAFVTHCGIGGAFEAIDAAKPLILVPFFFDQISNAALLERLGVGIYIDIWSMTTQKLLTGLNSIVNDTRYRDRMREVSEIFRDRPTSLQETVVYWTEYVLENKGASHLKNIAAGMPLYQYLLLDVILFVTVVAAGIIFGVYYLVKRVRAYVANKLETIEYRKKTN